MHWASWSAFWAMGGYATYIWGSYFVLFLFVLIEIILLLRGRKKNLQRLKRMKDWEGQ